MYLDESHFVDYIGKFKDGLWPGGQLKPSSPPRTAEERLRTRDEANRKLSALMPGKYLLMLPTTSINGRVPRFGRKYDWSVQRTPRSPAYIRCAAESTAQPTLALYDR